MRTSIVVTAAFLSVLPLVAARATGMGEIPCEQDLAKIQQEFDAKVAAMSPAQAHDFRQRLQVAGTQCRISLDDARPGLISLRQDLGQIASVPTDNEPPAGQ